MIEENPREKPYKFCPTCRTDLVRKEIDGKKLLSCPKCGFVFWNNPKPTVAVIIEKQGQVLLIKRALEPLKDYWRLPGGFIDYEEKPEEAVIRETKEETNLNIEIKELVGVYQIDNDPQGINIDMIYLGNIIGGNLKLNKESSEFKFFSTKELPKLIAYKHREAIMDWSKFIKK